MLGVALVVTVGVVISIGVRYLERRRLWRERAEHLQRRLVVALKRDTTLAGLVFVPEVAVDADGVTNVALSGVVPSEADRDRGVRAVRRQVARLFPEATADAPRAERNHRAHVMGNDHEVGVTVEDAREDEPAHGHRRFVRPAERPPEIELRPWLPRVVRDEGGPRRMQPDR